MDEEKIVNVSKVAKSVLSIGQFGLFQIEDMNLVVTNWFMLNVNEEQFWKIQCKLEVKQKNVWMFKGKDGLQPCTGASVKDIQALYCSIVYDQSEPIKRTYLKLGGIELFTDEEKYIGLQEKHLDMIDYAPTVKYTQGRESVIVDEVHIFTVVSKESIESKYLMPLAGRGA